MDSVKGHKNFTLDLFGSWKILIQGGKIAIYFTNPFMHESFNNLCRDNALYDKDLEVGSESKDPN